MIITTIESLVKQNIEELTALEDRLGYRFQNLSHLQKALIHRSYAFEKGRLLGEDNETLEFLGDAVLDLAIGVILFTRFPKMKEGELTKLRSALVNETHLALVAADLGLGKHLLLGKGEDSSKGRKKPSILSCAYEAVVGAIFLDGGYEQSLVAVRRLFEPRIDAAQEAAAMVDAKSRLQELTQELYNEAPAYLLESEDGPAHEKNFTVAVLLRGEVLATATAGSKKAAEQKAASLAIEKCGWEQRASAKG